MLVVAGAIVRAGRVLAAQRSYPAELAERWEFPGGKVERGELPGSALVREIGEELGVDVVVHERLGGDVPLRPGPGRLRLYRCSLSTPDAMPVAREHARLCWVDAPALDALGWLPTNRQLLPLVVAALAM